MNRKSTLGMLLAVLATVPAVVAPKLVAPAQAAAARDAAEYPDVPRGHWAYEALNRLSQAGIIEGLPNGTYAGNKPMTRYEFAVAIARLLDKIGPNTPGYDDTELRNRMTTAESRITATEATNTTQDAAIAELRARPVPDIFRADVQEMINALRREFADELAQLGVRVDALENRVSNLENRVQMPPRVTTSLSILHRTGTANYISQVPVAVPGGIDIVRGRNIVNGNDIYGPGVGISERPSLVQEDSSRGRTNAKYSYTDFEMRLTDRVTDRLSASAALRAQGSNQEDPWAGEPTGDTTLNSSGLYAREAYAVADLSGRTPFGVKGLSLILGRQHTRIGQGLLYNNDLAPTDQIHGMFNIGPLQISGFIGTTNNQTFSGAVNPYLTTGAVRYLGMGSTAAPVGGFFAPGNAAFGSGAAVGFPNRFASGGVAGGFPDDNESLVRVGFNLFRIAGQPVGIGISRMFDGVQNQRGDSVDLTVPLFNRTVGVEYVQQKKYYNGTSTNGNPSAYNVTLPVLRTRILDLDASYGKAQNAFEYFAASSANPFARTYAEALFDRPMALGAPMINGTGVNGTPLYMAAKEAYDLRGTVRLPLPLLRRIPIDFRYMAARGSATAGDSNGLSLGHLYSIGSTFNLSPGLDAEFKFGEYNPSSSKVGQDVYTIRYVRVGFNLGF